MELPNRKSIRLKGYNYSSNGAYFVTICTQNRECIFGDIINEEMVLNKLGRVLNQAIQQTPDIRKNIQIDIYQIMPNHIHIILIITHRVGAYCNTPLQSDNTPFRSPSQTIGSIVRGIKSVATKKIRMIVNNPEYLVFQRNFYEHIIRNESELHRIRKYIETNPTMWDRDRNNPQAKKDLTVYKP